MIQHEWRFSALPKENPPVFILGNVSTKRGSGDNVNLLHEVYTHRDLLTCDDARHDTSVMRIG